MEKQNNSRGCSRPSGPDYMSRAGPVSRVGSVCRDLVRLLNATKINFAITSQPGRLARRDPGIAIPKIHLDKPGHPA